MLGFLLSPSTYIFIFPLQGLTNNYFQFPNFVALCVKKLNIQSSNSSAIFILSNLNVIKGAKMAINKGSTEGGSGGGRGHSNMDHWEYTEEIKVSTKKLRRKQDKEEAKRGLQENVNTKNHT